MSRGTNLDGLLSRSGFTHRKRRKERLSLQCATSLFSNEVYLVRRASVLMETDEEWQTEKSQPSIHYTEDGCTIRGFLARFSFGYYLTMKNKGIR